MIFRTQKRRLFTVGRHVRAINGGFFGRAVQTLQSTFTAQSQALTFLLKWSPGAQWSTLFAKPEHSMYASQISSKDFKEIKDENYLPG